MSRGQLFWGCVLVLLGSLMLAGQMGVELPNGSSLMSLFWPLVLIGFGIWVLLSVFIRREVKSESASIDLQGASEASLRINHGAGEFLLHGGAAANEFMHGTFTGGLEHKTQRNGSQIEVKMRPVNDFIMPTFGGMDRLDWDVSLNSSIPTALDMNMGANKSVIDLRDMKITSINFKSGASDTVITLPAQGRLKVTCDVGAASLTLIVPDGVSIRARATIGAGEFKVDRSRFSSDTSPDFETAPNAVDIHVTGGAASVRVK